MAVAARRAPRLVVIEPHARGGWTVLDAGTTPKPSRFTTTDLAERDVLEHEQGDVAVVVRDAYHRVLRISRSG